MLSLWEGKRFAVRLKVTTRAVADLATHTGIKVPVWKKGESEGLELKESCVCVCV